MLILLVLRTGRIELVAVAVLISYASASIALLPFLRRELSVGILDILAQIWPAGPALIVGYIITSLLPDSLGGTIITLAARVLITASIVALTHGLCTPASPVLPRSGRNDFAKPRARSSIRPMH